MRRANAVDHLSGVEITARLLNGGHGFGMLFASAGVCKVYLETKAFSEQANRYQRMALSMSLARSRLDKAISAGDANGGRDVPPELSST